MHVAENEYDFPPLLLQLARDREPEAVRVDLGGVRDQGLAVVLISHNLVDVFQVADRIAALYLGQLAAEVREHAIVRQDAQLIIRKQHALEEVVFLVTDKAKTLLFEFGTRATGADPSRNSSYHAASCRRYFDSRSRSSSDMPLGPPSDASGSLLQ